MILIGAAATGVISYVSTEAHYAAMLQAYGNAAHLPAPLWVLCCIAMLATYIAGIGIGGLLWGRPRR